MPARRLAWLGVALSTLGILIATLHTAGDVLPKGWDFHITNGDDAFAALIQNLLLFIPLGASLAWAGVPGRYIIALGFCLSFTVEFLQQWIPGRDPSAGDVVCNTTSTALGVALVRYADRWLWVAPRRSAAQALAIAVLAVLVWYATGWALHPIPPAPPYRELTTPDLRYWGQYKGRVLQASGDIDSIAVTAVAPPRRPGRASPLVAFVDQGGDQILMFAVDHDHLVLRHDMPALHLTLEQLDLRWRHALASVAPGDTFFAQTWRSGNAVCFGFNATTRCGFGFTAGDGWKLIFYPETFPPWLLGFINVLWMVGWTVGIGYWAKRRVWVASVAVVGIGLVVVPLMTGLKPTPLLEWIAVIVGLSAIPVARKYQVKDAKWSQDSSEKSLA